MSAVPAGYKQTEVGVIPVDWVVGPVGGLVEKVKSGLSRRLQAQDIGIPVLTSGNIQNNRLVIDDLKYWYAIDPQGANTENYILDDGDILLCFINSLSQIGKPCIFRDIGRPVIYTTNIFRVVVANRCAPEFVFFLFSSTAFQEVLQLIVKPAINQASFTKADFLRIGVPFPPKESEQRAIAAALSDVDALLAKLDQFIAKKRDLKQAAMQQLLTGQTRLPGFSGAWEVKRLGDVGTCLRGVSYRGDSDLFAYDTDRTKRLLRSNNVQDASVVAGDIQFVNCERVSERQLLRERDILICMANGSKALVGKAGFFRVHDGYEYTFGAFMGCFRSSSAHANASFVFYLFQTGRYRNYINNLLAGSSINNLTPTSIESLEFQMPSLTEQTAIATVLSDMDAELAALEARRDKTRALKQGMMQELLIGRIRLV